MEIVIRAGERRTGLADLWRYRELFRTLAWRDISVRYKQTILGVAWALLQPALTMVILTFVFGRLAGFRDDTAGPYALVVLAGVLAWQLFSGSLTACSLSLLSNANLIGKVFFPRLLVPVAAGVVGLVDFLVTLILLGVVMMWFGVFPDWRMLLVPAFAVLGYLAALGPGMIAGALNVRFRDFRFIVPFAVQIGLYVSPVAYPMNVVRRVLGEWSWLYALNPMVGVIEAFRWAVVPGYSFDAVSLSMSIVVIAMLLWIGLRFFCREERAFADVI